MTKAKFLGHINKSSTSQKESIQFVDRATLKDMIGQLLSMIGKPLNSPSCYPIRDIIQIIKEIKHIIVSDQIELIEYLREDVQVMTVLMVLLTRDYALKKAGEQESCGEIDGGVWVLEADDLMQLLGHVCVSVANLLLCPEFAHRAYQAYDQAVIMKEILVRYILEDFFGVDRLVKEQKIEEFRKVTGLAEDLIWLTNNIIIEEHQHKSNEKAALLQNDDDLS